MRKLVCTISLGIMAVAIALLPTTARAQSTTGAIEGVVSDTSGAPLESVTVVATSPALLGSMAETTDDEGAYLLSNLPPGTYEVVFFGAGKSVVKVRQQNVHVRVGATSKLSIKMDPGGKEVIVRVKRKTIDATGTKISHTVDRDQLTKEPFRVRTWQGALTAAPSAQVDDLGVGFGGSGSSESIHVVDGQNTTGVAFGGGNGAPVLNDFIQEIEIITGGYNAEFGRSTGGVVNVVTKSGSNDFHGSVFANARPFEAERENVFVAGSALDARATLGYDVDFGFDLGGPILKDRIWFYVGFAPQLTATNITRIAGTRVDRRVNDIRYVDADGDGRLDDGDGVAETDPNPGCELLPKPTGRQTACETDNLADLDQQTGFEVFEEIERRSLTQTNATYSFLGKLSFAANPDNQGQLSIIGTPSTSHAVGIVGTPLATQQDGTSMNLNTSLKWTSKFLENKLELDGVIGWYHDKKEAGPIDDAARLLPRISADRSNLGAIGRNPDQPESNTILQFCTETDPAIRDDFPTITNCPVFGYGFNSLGGFTDVQEDRYSAKATATWRLKLAGHHKVKFGLDAEDNFLTDKNGVTSGLAYTLTSQRYWNVFTYARRDPAGTDRCGFEEDGVTPVACNFLGENGDAFERSTETFNWSGFVQDSWQLMPNLLVNAGLRYEEQRLKTAKQIRGVMDPITGTTLGEDALDLDFLLAPRVGALYDWTKEGRSKIYASWGRFFESVPMDINNRAFGGEAFYNGLWDARDVNVCAPWSPDGRGSDFTPRLPSDPRTCDLSQPALADQLIGGGNAKLGLPPGVSSLVQPGLAPQYLDEFVAGVEYELLEDLRLGLSYQNRSLGRVVEDVSTDGADTYIISNPGEFSAGEERALEAQVAAELDPVKHDALQSRLDMFRRVRQFDKPRRDYDAVQLTVLKRFSTHLLVQGSYTYSRSRGNYPGLYSPNNGQNDPNITSQYDLVELLANRDGRLPQDRPHNFKLDGYYTFDLKQAGAITTGVRLRGISGTPISTLGAHTYGANESFILPRGSWGRTAFTTGADLRVQYSRDLGKDMTLSVYFDLFNVFNQQSQASVDEAYTTDLVSPIVGGGRADLNYLKVVDGGGFETRAVAQKGLNYGNTDGRLAPLAGRFGVRLEF